MLRSTGVFFCAYEPVLPQLLPFSGSLFSRFEKKLGISEHAFTCERWRTTFHGFEIVREELRPPAFVPFVSPMMVKYITGGEIALVAVKASRDGDKAK